MQVIKSEINLPAVETIILNPAALQERQDLLDKGQTFQSCPDADAQGRIIRHARTIKNLVKDVDGDLKKWTKPLDLLKKALKAKGEEYLAPLEAEASRLASLTVPFQQEEARRVAEEQAKRDAEIRAKLLAAKNAEEDAKKAQVAVTSEEAGLSELERAALAEMDAAQKQEAYVQALRTEQPKAERVTGQALRKVLVYEIKDVKALFAAYPDTCEIVPVKSKVRELLEAGIELPGVTHHWEQAVSIRA